MTPFVRRLDEPRPSATLYTRPGCGLCEVARELLVHHNLSPELIDIDADPALRERFTNCVPVVFIDGKERFRGRVNEVMLRRILKRWRESS